MEDIREGERIREYRLEGLIGPDRWQTLARGISVGHKRIQKFDRKEVAKVKLVITKSVGKPIIRRLALFKVT